jgi:hypothetical protein
MMVGTFVRHDRFRNGADIAHVHGNFRVTTVQSESELNLKLSLVLSNINDDGEQPFAHPRDCYADAYDFLAFSKDLQDKTYTCQGWSPEPVWRRISSLMSLLMYGLYSPIPQWFRLKTDTKIQVRSEMNLSSEILLINPFLVHSTMPRGDTGGGRS